MKTLKYISLYISILIIVSTGCKNELNQEKKIHTICNPIDINYRFGLEMPSRREAADPTVVLYKDHYFLFASKSGGYWFSKNLYNWNFVTSKDLPLEDYAPTAIVIDDTLYFMASSQQKNSLFKAINPFDGKWQVKVEEMDLPAWDPAFFMDDDKRLYLYWGCSDVNPIYGIELDYRNHFAYIGKPKVLIHANPTQIGWEVPGDQNNIKQQMPWIEGAWMNKLNGKYYLQYSGPGTEFESYCDAVYVGDTPLGPYQLQEHNPFAYKPKGFGNGAGHGSTFADKYGNLWHFGTISISQKHIFERRLGLFPVFLDSDGVLYSDTRLGDYPLMIPDRKINHIDDISPNWMLLSYHKKVEVSSSIDSLPSENLTDENIRTYWSAKTGDKGEFVMIDLGDKSSVYAMQINFADHHTQLLGYHPNKNFQYQIEYSNDLKNWKMLIDRSNSSICNPHQYIQLPQKKEIRYLRLTNHQVCDGNFALSGWRIFGHGSGEKPAQVKKIDVSRNKQDRRSVRLQWEASKNANAYLIKYGIDKNKLYQNI